MVRLERHATVLRKPYFLRVFLPDPVHNACIKMTEAPGKGGALYSVWGGIAHEKRPVYSSAPLIFSSALLCDHKRVGIKRFPPLLK